MEKVFDIIRKKYVLLTPEEEVRQYIIKVLVNEKKIPASLIRVEAEISLGKLKKRFDILVYDKNLNPWLIIECKRKEQNISSDEINQVLRYNQVINAHYLLITNGKDNYCFKNTSPIEILNDFPQYNL